MLAKYAIAGLAGSALLASVAFAQTPSSLQRPIRPPPPRLRLRPIPRHVQGQLAVRRRLVGLSVYNDKQRKPRIDQRSA